MAREPSMPNISGSKGLSVPFISVLYMATLLFPLMLPAGASIDSSPGRRSP